MFIDTGSTTVFFAEQLAQIGGFTVATNSAVVAATLAGADKRSRAVQVPSLHGPTKAPFEWPISSFAEYASNNISAQSYLASVRHAIVTEKETAILAFRSAAEQRIYEFDRGLAGRQLDGHWRKGASGLIARLQAGLGDKLAGISEGARGKALDWCAEIRRTRKASPTVAKQVTNGSGRAAPTLAAGAAPYKRPDPMSGLSPTP